MKIVIFRACPECGFTGADSVFPQIMKDERAQITNIRLRLKEQLQAESLAEKELENMTEERDGLQHALDRLNAGIDMEARKRAENIVQDRIQRSRHTIKGQVSEGIAPLMPGFPCNLSDARFAGGKPLDYLGFVGLSIGYIKEVRLIHVKDGKAKLSPMELSVDAAILDGRVTSHTFRKPTIPAPPIIIDKRSGRPTA